MIASLNDQKKKRERNKVTPSASRIININKSEINLELGRIDNYVIKARSKEENLNLYFNLIHLS